MIVALLVSVALAAPVPTPTTTPWMGRDGIDYLIGPNGLPFPVLWPKVAEAQTAVAKISGAWIVTATATASPTARPMCERIGHDWPEWDRDDKSERALAHLLSGPRCEYRRAHPNPLYPDGDDGRPMLVRCRRCNLWKEVGACCQ